MRTVPLTRDQANALIRAFHRHHKPVVGYRWAVGAEVDGVVVGAAVVGRPVARATEQYRVAEVTRLVTNGHKNACSFLYAAAARIAKEMGFRRIQTYILDSEPGVSLRAAGWVFEGYTEDSHRWTNREGRRADQPEGRKQRWAKVLGEGE